VVVKEPGIRLVPDKDGYKSKANRVDFRGRVRDSWNSRNLAPEKDPPIKEIAFDSPEEDRGIAN